MEVYTQVQDRVIKTLEDQMTWEEVSNFKMR